MGSEMCIRDRNTTIAADTPYGHLTANPYDTNTKRLLAAATYDFGDLTVEAQGRMGRLERTSREALKGDDNGFALTALYHANDRISFRGTYDDSKRTAEGHTVYGFQNDEAERKTKRTGIDVEFSLPKGVDLTFAYFLRDVEYSNRPDRVPVTSGVPTPGGVAFPNTGGEWPQQMGDPVGVVRDERAPPRQDEVSGNGAAHGQREEGDNGAPPGAAGNQHGPENPR